MGAAAAVCCYGAGIDRRLRVSSPVSPLLLVYGGEDQFIDGSEVGRVAVGLHAAGARFAMDVHDGADHAFLNRHRPDRFHADAAARAWRHIAAFLDEHLA